MVTQTRASRSKRLIGPPRRRQQGRLVLLRTGLCIQLEGHNLSKVGFVPGARFRVVILDESRLAIHLRPSGENTIAGSKQVPRITATTTLLNKFRRGAPFVAEFTLNEIYITMGTRQSAERAPSKRKPRTQTPMIKTGRRSTRLVSSPIEFEPMLNWSDLRHRGAKPIYG